MGKAQAQPCPRGAYKSGLPHACGNVATYRFSLAPAPAITATAAKRKTRQASAKTAQRTDIPAKVSCAHAGNTRGGGLVIQALVIQALVIQGPVIQGLGLVIQGLGLAIQGLGLAMHGHSLAGTDADLLFACGRRRKLEKSPLPLADASIGTGGGLAWCIGDKEGSVTSNLPAGRPSSSPRASQVRCTGALLLLVRHCKHYTTCPTLQELWSLSGLRLCLH